MFITYNKSTGQIYCAAESNDPCVPDGYATVEYAGSFADFPAHPAFCRFVNGAVLHAPEIEAGFAPDYATRRAAEYPPLVEQLDALWKGGSSLEEMREHILGVKAKYPKKG